MRRYCSSRQVVFVRSVEIWQDHMKCAEAAVNHHFYDTMDSSKGTHKEFWGDEYAALKELVRQNALGDQGVPTCDLFP